MSKSGKKLPIKKPEAGPMESQEAGLKTMDEISNSPERIKFLVTASANPPLERIKDTEWRVAVHRGDALKALLSAPAKVSEVRTVAKRYGVDPSTLYRWLEKYRSGGGRLSALMRTPRCDAGTTRLDPRVEAILSKAVEAYMTDQRRIITSLWADVEEECLAQKLDIPHINTLRNRIKQVSDHLLIAGRFGAKVAREKYGHLPSMYEGATAPHAMVQVDHTVTDVIVLDEETRLPIGRPYITVVLDVYSRAVLGFYLSLDPPSALSVGLALVNAVLPKQPWIDRLGLTVTWPCQGLIGCLYTDNALEFHSELLDRACREYGIDLQYRPLTRPEFGGHIERFMRTLMKEMHSLPGTTFSNVAEKGEYDSAARACMTLRELEMWVIHFIAGVYHNRPHRGIEQQTPLQRYEKWFAGQGMALGITGAPMPDDERRFRIDLLPSKKRTIQRGGVEMFFGKLYWDDQLHPFIGEKQLENPTKGQKFHFAYDPRDISIIYFWHPVESEYVPIPQKDTSMPPMSYWELRERSKVRAEDDPVALSKVRGSRKAMRETEDGAKAKTQGARRKGSRARLHRTENIHQTLAETSLVQEGLEASTTAPHITLRTTVESWVPSTPFLDIE